MAGLLPNKPVEGADGAGAAGLACWPKSPPPALLLVLLLPNNPPPAGCC